MKSKNSTSQSAYERAQKRVSDIKGFYGHLVAFIIVNVIVMYTNGRFFRIQGDDSIYKNIDFLNWIDWNVYGTAIIWGFFLFIHGISVFGKNPFLGRKWEERQIQKYMNKD